MGDFGHLALNRTAHSIERVKYAFRLALGGVFFATARNPEVLKSD